MVLSELDAELNYKHHEKGILTHKSFEKQVASLVQVIKDYGSPFMDACPEVLILNARDCDDEAVVSSVPQIETLGQLQYEE